MYERILVPLDGSGRAEHALPYAEWIAKRLNSTVTLLTGCAQNDPMLRALSVYLDKQAEDVRKLGIEVNSLMRLRRYRRRDTGLRGEEPNWADRHDLARCERDDPLVSRRRGPEGGAPLQVHPILLVRTAERHAARLEEGVRSILVPLDGSPVAESILPHIQDLALATGLEVILLQVTVPIGYPAVARDNVEADKHEKDVKKLNETRAAATRFYLTEREKELASKGVKVSTVSLTGKPASDLILQYISDNPIGMTALATHGFSGISKWAFGSVAIDILEGSTRPLLLLRPPLPSIR